ncbi:MAG: RHS repeat protein, partial [Lachnospiraceae bacterium]|nr:RHS repeat protein [Lachnospiraceae bacterium]
DLKAAFGDDLVAAAKHYIEYGYNESRTQIQKPAPVPSVPTTTTVVDGDVTSIYDADGKLIKEIYQDGSYLNYSYNSAGKLAKVERSTGEWITFEYDAKGNCTKETYSDGTWEEYEYDVNGKLTQSTASNGKVTDYDAEERRIRVTYLDGRLTTYEYDANGMPYKEYRYGTAGKIESVMESSYDANGAWQGQTETSYYDYETNKIFRIVVWDNTGEIISDVSYHEDGTVIE